MKQELKPANRVNQGGHRGNRNVVKEDYTKKHKAAKPKGIIDERTIIVEVVVQHPNRGTLILKMESYKMDYTLNKLKKDNWIVLNLNK